MEGRDGAADGERRMIPRVVNVICQSSPLAPFLSVTYY